MSNEVTTPAAAEVSKKSALQLEVENHVPAPVGDSLKINGNQHDLLLYMRHVNKTGKSPERIAKYFAPALSSNLITDLVAEAESRKPGVGAAKLLGRLLSDLFEDANEYASHRDAEGNVNVEPSKILEFIVVGGIRKTGATKKELTEAVNKIQGEMAALSITPVGELPEKFKIPAEEEARALKLFNLWKSVEDLQAQIAAKDAAVSKRKKAEKAA